MKKKIALILTVLFIIFFIYFLIENRNTLNSLKSISIKHIAALAFLTVVYLFTNGLILKFLAQPFNIHIKNYFLLSIASSFVNLITPFRGGAAFRAWWMKEKYNFNYLDFTISLIGNYLIVLLVNSVVAILLLIYFHFYENISNLPLLLFFSALSIGCVCLMAFELTIKGNGKIATFFNKIQKNWHDFSKKPSIIIKLLSITVFQIVITSLIFFFILDGVGNPIKLYQSLFLAVFSNLALYVNITPGSLGIFESFLMISGIIINIPAEIMLLSALVYRATTTIILFAFGIPAKFTLLKIIAK